jgi:hypothetical protein
MTSVLPVLAVAWLAQVIAQRRRLAARSTDAASSGEQDLTEGVPRARAPRSAARSLLLLGAGALVAATAWALLVGPVVAHNAAAGAGWTVSTNNERNFFLGNNPYTPDYKTSHLGQRSLDELSPDARSYLEGFYDRPDARVAMRHAALQYVLTHPARTALRTLNRATSFWGFDYIASREIQKAFDWGQRKTLPLLALEAGSYLAVLALAVVVLVVGRGRSGDTHAGEPPAPVRGALTAPGQALAYDRTWCVWLVALALAYELPYAIAFSGGTYHFPVLPLLIPFAAVAVASPKATWRRLRASGPAWIALALLGAIELQYAYYAWTMSA